MTVAINARCHYCRARRQLIAGKEKTTKQPIWACLQHAHLVDPIRPKRQHEPEASQQQLLQ